MQGCRFVPYTFSETIPQMVDIHIGFQGLALIQGQIYTLEMEFLLIKRCFLSALQSCSRNRFRGPIGTRGGVYCIRPGQENSWKSFQMSYFQGWTHIPYILHVWYMEHLGMTRSKLLYISRQYRLVVAVVVSLLRGAKHLEDLCSGQWLYLGW